mmetsp:Transcript_19093/g.28888  ORF Transcript_19093/g.28888 Transcript_19093/m.28888 type:complete len:1479 (-) Transcript_19093:398-4834(-)|eukprot:CAMPEP_0197308766 /NCGR_PEP_ID=MMETSP0891-20130614/7266_1 /TAXON_ID=44058 ORGANISM="Aureoumbra lagunensis, Strain CCMP1510" /NCGR_SAMPLE_ID=MMETSP0891 /ASSEMBLY_ACC=CAM_ASM_000534 /LENGTH=1478 /DNA_ID=CAMNT_0042793439 /DNA_START=9 /DNA_END=4445 /DNA_ORIENTATION=-
MVKYYLLGTLLLPTDENILTPLKTALESLVNNQWIRIEDIDGASSIVWCSDEAVRNGTSGGNELRNCLGIVLAWVYSENSRCNASYTLDSLLDTSTAACASQRQGWPSAISTRNMLKDRGMITELFNYQLAAVEFMVKRENFENSIESVHAVERGWRQLSSELAWHPVTGVVCDVKAIQVPAVKGGCLFDEVGLGKTIITLSLVLLRPSPSPIVPPSFEEPLTTTVSMRPDLRCICGQIKKNCEILVCTKCGRPHHKVCWSQGYDQCLACEILAAETNLIRGKTLIVCPTAIVGQWIQEAQRHAPRLKVLRYWGIKKMQENNLKNDQRQERLNEARPSKMSTYDVVLCTYDVFTKEYVNTQTNIHKVYALLKSPLRVIHWHRVVLDEAQMVEKSASNATKLALELHADFRWCVSGTPTQNGLSVNRAFFDLISLLLFLGAFNSRAEATQCLAHCAHFSSFLARYQDLDHLVFDYEAVSKLMARIAWRATKTAVGEHVLKIPQIYTIEHTLDFTQVESIFYNDNKRRIAKQVASLPVVKKRSQDIHAICAQVAPHLQALRQACCHPSAVTSSNKKRKHVDNNGKEFLFLTLDQVHTNLCLGARIDLENEHRALILQRNALAGLVHLKAQKDKNLLVYKHAALLYTCTLNEINETRGCVEVIGDVELIDENTAFRRQSYERGAWVSLTAGYTRIDTEHSVRLVAIAVKAKSTPLPIVLQVKTSLEIYEPVTIHKCRTSEDSFQIFVVRWSGSDARPRGREWRIKCEHEIAIRLFQAETDADVHTELHAVHNLLRVLESPYFIAEEHENSSMIEDWPWTKFLAQEIQNNRDELRQQRTRLENTELKYYKSVHKTQYALLMDALQKSEVHSEDWREPRRLRVQIHNYGGWHRFLEDKLRRPLELREMHADPRVVQWLNMPNIEFMCNRIACDFAELDFKRDTCLNQIKALTTEPSLEEMQNNFNCQFCRSDHFATGPKCSHCKLREQLDSLESSLFFFKQQRQDGVGRFVEESLEGGAPVWRAGRAAGAHAVRHGNSFARESLALMALEALASISDDQNEAKAEVAARRARMSELSLINKLWKCHHDLLSELDTLRGAKLTSEFANSQEEINEASPDLQRTLLLRSDVMLDDRILKTVHDLEDALKKFRSAKSQLTFKLNKLNPDDDQSTEVQYPIHLDVLEKALGCRSTEILQLPVLEQENTMQIDDEAANDDLDKETCMFCLEHLPPSRRAVLSICSHELCCNCVEKEIKRAGGIKCGLCREWHTRDDVLVPRAVKSAGSKHVRTFGTKLSTIVAHVEKEVQKGDKVLIFSEFDTVNDIFAAALKDRNLMYEQPKSCNTKNWQDIIFRFHSDPMLSILVLNVRTAAAGLNITAANHVFFTHPLLHKSDELQAIGRCHRLGQTKPVYLHHYFVADTIEPILRTVTNELHSQQSSASHHTRHASGQANVARAVAEIFQSPEDIQKFFDLTADDIYQSQKPTT